MVVDRGEGAEGGSSRVDMGFDDACLRGATRTSDNALLQPPSSQESRHPPPPWQTTPPCRHVLLSPDSPPAVLIAFSRPCTRPPRHSPPPSPRRSFRISPSSSSPPPLRLHSTIPRTSRFPTRCYAIGSNAHAQPPALPSLPCPAQPAK